MGLWEWMKSIFTPNLPEPPSPLKLGANSESELSSSLRRLSIGQWAWITLDEAASLFSPMEAQKYAFGGLDDEGRKNLAEFASRIEHRSSF
jgi:hypothetical protein